MGLLTPLVQGLQYITVEPIIFLFFWSIPYIDHGNGALLFHKFCLESYNETLCMNTSNHPTENQIIQSEASRWIMYSKVVMVLPMLYSTVMLGAISDRFQRKLPMIVPAAGIFLGTVWLMFIALFQQLNVRMMLLSSFLFGLTGYSGAALMATSAYLGHVTDASVRTWRIAVYEAALSCGLVIGSFTSGLIIDGIGLPGLYGITAGLNFLAGVYTIVRITETHTFKQEKPLWGACCDLGHVKSYVSTLYKVRPQNRRFYIHMVFAAFMTITCSTMGLYDILFLYLTKARGFSNTYFSAYTGTQSALSLIYNLLAMWLLQRFFRISEPWILFMAASGGLISFGMSSAKEHLSIWLSLLFVGTVGLAGAAARGFLSKLVPTEEQGQVFAFIAMGQCMVSLLASVIFNNLYPETLKFWDGFCILLAGLLNLLAMALSVIVIMHRKYRKHDDEALHLVEETSTSAFDTSNKGDNSDDESDQLDIIDQAAYFHKGDIAVNGRSVESYGSVLP